MLSQPIDQLIKNSISTRKELLEELHTEKTDTYRLFHGTNEGCEGLTIDRYGDQLLIQTFHQSLDSSDLDTIEKSVKSNIHFDGYTVYNDRSPQAKKNYHQVSDDMKPKELFPDESCFENGIKYAMNRPGMGKDPLLFLDMRAGRRYLKENCSGKTVLNLFAYTCGFGICAAVGGATEVWNVDFAESSLNYGKQSLLLNSLDSGKVKFIHEDYFPVIRQLAGLPVKGRARRRKRQFVKLSPQLFDLVILDPPRWAKSPFGAVDLLRDYQSVFKPALLTVSSGGNLICTNHIPKVDLHDWLEGLKRCAIKAGKPIKSLEVIEPEKDFPSPDGKHPLKIALIEV